MNLTTPALLFPAISLLFLAYTNRFLVLAQLIRQLHGQQKQAIKHLVQKQIANLQKRLALIRLMQVFGVMSFIICSLSMMGLFFNYIKAAEILFGFSLLFLVLSLLVSLYEIVISTGAIRLELQDMEQHSADKEHM
jgi:hypothetical protein